MYLFASISSNKSAKMRAFASLIFVVLAYATEGMNLSGNGRITFLLLLLLRFTITIFHNEVAIFYNYNNH